MRITIDKGPTDDSIHILRDDGSMINMRFPHKGPFPHDAVHFAVERQLAMGNAFWGKVAAGADPETIAAAAKAAGHPSAARAAAPDADIVQLVQAERIVECFEADHWGGGGGDPVWLADMADLACKASLVPMPAMTAADIAMIRAAIADMAGQWRTGRLILDWPPAA